MLLLEPFLKMQYKYKWLLENQRTHAIKLNLKLGKIGQLNVVITMTVFSKLGSTKSSHKQSRNAVFHIQGVCDNHCWSLKGFAVKKRLRKAAL